MTELPEAFNSRHYVNAASTSKDIYIANRDLVSSDAGSADGTMPATTKNPEVEKLFTLYQVARNVCSHIPEAARQRAYFEALYITNSRLFPDYVVPSVTVDDCGEYSFSHRSNHGYLDIGVNGEGELSFHVRNDEDPEATAYGDVPFNGPKFPDELILAMTNLLGGYD